MLTVRRGLIACNRIISIISRSNRSSSSNASVVVVVIASPVAVVVVVGCVQQKIS